MARSNDLIFEKNNENDVIMWAYDPERDGEHLFSFDGVHVFNLFADYPHKLTAEQKTIFDRENPVWAMVLSGRE